VQLLDRAIGALRIAVQRGFDREFLHFFGAVRLEGSACATAFRERRPVVVKDVATDPSFDEPSRAVVLRAGVRAVQSTPLLSTDGAVPGVLSTHYARPAEASAGSVSLVRRCARLAAALIELRSPRAERPVAATVPEARGRTASGQESSGGPGRTRQRPALQRL
jgi:GAF domain-containing protein